MKTITISTLASAAFFALACTGGGTTTTTTEAPVAPPAPAPVAAPAPATGEVGVAECDQYIKDMTACLGTMDAATKAAMESSFKQTADAWRAAAATPEGKAGLQMGCKAALDAIPANCKAGATTTPVVGTAPVGAAGTTTVTTGGGTTTVTTGGTTTTVTTGTGTTPATTKPEGKADGDGAGHPHKQGKSINRH